MLEVVRSGLLQSARAQGLASAAVIGKHALPGNAMLPIVTILGLSLAPELIGGSVIGRVDLWRFRAWGHAQWCSRSSQRDYRGPMGHLGESSSTSRWSPTLLSQMPSAYGLCCRSAPYSAVVGRGGRGE